MIFSPEILPSVDLVSLHGHVDADMETLGRERTQVQVFMNHPIFWKDHLSMKFLSYKDTDPALHEKPQRMRGQSYG